MAGIASKITGLATNVNVVSGALGREKEVEAARTFLNKSEWKAAWGAYKMKQLLTGEKKHNVPSDLDVPGLCEDIQHLKPRELVGTATKQIKQGTGKVAKVILEQVISSAASAPSVGPEEVPKNAVFANAKIQGFRNSRGRFSSAKFLGSVFVKSKDGIKKVPLSAISEDEVASIMQDASNLAPHNIQKLARHAQSSAYLATGSKNSTAEHLSRRIDALPDANQKTRAAIQLQELAKKKSENRMFTRSMKRFANALKAPNTRKSRKARKAQ